MTKQLLTGGMILVLALSASLPAFAESESDGGYFDYISDGGSIGNRYVSWFWQPHYFPGGVDYSLFILCERYDANGQAVGNNRVVIQDIAFLGLDSNRLLELNRTSRKLGKFRRNGFLVISAPDLELLASDSFVVAEMQFQVKGSSGSGQIKCSADVTEIPIIGAESKATAKPASARTVTDILRERPVR